MAAAVMAQPLPVHGQESFVFEGSGWGHAVGFSQWGGYGQAQEDPSKPGEQIAAHYFPGTAPASLSDLELPNDLLTAMERPLWINLGVQITLLEFTPVGGPVDLCQAGDGEGSCPKPEQPQEGERWQFRRLDVGRCGFFKDGEMQGAEGECRASISWPEADGVQLRYGPDRRRICALRSGECEYRRGELKIRDDPVEEGFHVVLAVGLEDYLRGIAEVPAYWEAPGVNEAQAVAARTYAVFKFFQYERAPRPEDPDWDPGVGPSRRDSCWCHMYDNTRDQEYVGWRREDGPVHAAWVSGVEATQGRVLTYFGPDWERYTKGGVIQGFYSASTGGVTTSNRYGFFTEWDGKTPSQKPWPYLTPVDDSWAVDPQLGNPHVSWRREITASRLAEILEWDEVAAVELEAGPSLSSPARVRFTGTDGGEEVTKTAAGAWLRYGLGLRSSHITAVDGRSAPPSEEPEEPKEPDRPEEPVDPDEPEDIGPVEPSDPCLDQSQSDECGRYELPHFWDAGGSPHEPGIRAIQLAGITRGCRPETFEYCPDDLVDRGTMATFLARSLWSAAGIPRYEQRFEDVPGSHPHAASINALAERGVTQGCGDGERFCPGDSLTRGAMASFLRRALDLQPLDSLAYGRKFEDVSDDHAHRGSIYAVAAEGITIGCQDGTVFCPDEPLTRGAIATFMARAFIWYGPSPPDGGR